MLPIELISHFSRVLSLSLRLFGNIFGEELVILILASIIPFIVPLPMMLLGLLTGTLQAYIFVHADDDLSRRARCRARGMETSTSTSHTACRQPAVQL